MPSYMDCIDWLSIRIDIALSLSLPTGWHYIVMIIIFVGLLIRLTHHITEKKVYVQCNLLHTPHNTDRSSDWSVIDQSVSICSLCCNIADTLTGRPVLITNLLPAIVLLEKNNKKLEIAHYMYTLCANCVVASLRERMYWLAIDSNR